MYKNVAVCQTVSQQIRDFIEPFMFFEATQQGTRSHFGSSQIARHTQTHTAPINTTVFLLL